MAGLERSALILSQHAAGQSTQSIASITITDNKVQSLQSTAKLIYRGPLKRYHYIFDNNFRVSRQIFTMFMATETGVNTL